MSGRDRPGRGAADGPPPAAGAATMRRHHSAASWADAVDFLVSALDPDPQALLLEHPKLPSAPAALFIAAQKLRLLVIFCMVAERSSG